MSSRDRYYKMMANSVRYIFKHFLNDASISEVYETQSKVGNAVVAVEIDGTLKGEILISLPKSTLEDIAKKFAGGSRGKALQKHVEDVSGELTNMITGTFANQMQFAGHDIRLSPPEFNDDPINMKALYENVNLSFVSAFGGFDIDLYYKEKI